MADLSKMILPNGDEYTLRDSGIVYCTCDTAASTAAKVIDVADDAPFTLRVGSIIAVKFSNSNSANNVTLNVGNTGAKPIWYNNSQYNSNSTNICGYANRVNYYMYNGEHWVFLSNGIFNADTKNTAGSTDTSSKIFLIGATSQAANPQTYSDNEVYATSGVLTTKSTQVGGGAVTLQYNSTTQSLDFIFA